MVDAVISFVVENLVKIAKDEAVLLTGQKKKLQHLSDELIAIRAVLQDAEMRQIRDEAIRIWLQNLKYVAYEIQDMLEEWGQVRNFSSPLSFLKHPIRQHKFGSRVNAITEKLAEISSQKERYHFRKFKVSDARDRQTSSLIDHSSIIGRDVDKEILIRKLISKGELVCKKDEVPAISIIGMGGLGKTTLAQVVFNTEGVKNCFEKCIWVCISNDFDIKDVMMNIVKSGGGNIGGQDGQVELIQQKVKELIGSKRYLLVLDDVWNEDELKWEPLQRVLNCGASESRIIVTTRNKGVAHAIRSAYIHDLGLLSNDECWSIFTNMVFQGSNDDEGFGDLEDIGRKIVEKCDGLPLAVKTTASVIWKKMRGKHPTLEQLENVLNSEIWELQSEVGILPALLLSYSELPSHLKNCFCYCSLFQKDFLFERDLLIKFWVAQGYVIAKDHGNKELESVGKEYFDELLDRSLFQEPREDEYGNITGCKMHDLVHDLAQWVAKAEFSTIKVKHAENRLVSLGNARHCAVLEKLEWNRDISSIGVEDLRTLIYLVDEKANVPINAINRLRSVRVLSLERTMIKNIHRLKRLVHLRYLNLSCTEIKVLPEAIGKLKQLRYLDLSWTNIEKLPKAIISLFHLQTLNLNGCHFLKELPDGIAEMGNLRHLHIESCVRLTKLRDGIGRLTLLQTLINFPVATVEGGGRSNIGELGGLNQLRGILRIEGLEAVVSSNEACNAKLKDKTFLSELTFSWNLGDKHLSMFALAGIETPPPIEGLEIDDYPGGHVAFDVLEVLQPPPQLQVLSINDYPGGSFPSWMDGVTFLDRLREVSLWTCNNCTRLPSLGQLPCLKRLSILGLPRVEKVGEEFLFGPVQGTSMVGFPQLEKLSFEYMHNWNHWEKPIKNDLGSTSGSPTTMPLLRELSLTDCPKLKEMPSIFTTALQTLYIKDSPVLGSLQFLPPNIKNLTLAGVSTENLLADCSRLPSLKHLAIRSDWTLKELPSTIIHLSLLQSLEITNCANLVSLPEEFMQMSSMQELKIYGCSKLNEKCKRGGCLWPRVCHIPDFYIDEYILYW